MEICSLLIGTRTFLMYLGNTLPRRRIAIRHPKQSFIIFSGHEDGSAVVVDCIRTNQAVKENPCRGFSRFGWCKWCAADNLKTIDYAQHHHRAGCPITDLLLP